MLDWYQTLGSPQTGIERPQDGPDGADLADSRRAEVMGRSEYLMDSGSPRTESEDRITSTFVDTE